MSSHKLVLILLGVFCVSFAAHAATTPLAYCQPNPAVISGGVGSTTIQCPAFTVPGATLTSVHLGFAADYQFGQAPGGAPGGTHTVNVTFTPATPAGVTWTPPSVTLSINGTASSGSVPTGGADATAGVSTAAFSSPFNVGVVSTNNTDPVATSSAQVSVMYTYDPPPTLTLACPSTVTGVVGTPYSGALVRTGGVGPTFTFSITGGSLAPGLTLNTATGAITGTPTSVGSFTFTAQVVDSINTAATTAASCPITITNITPPPSGLCSTAAAAVTFGNQVQPPDSFLVRYAANLNLADSYINVVNYGLNGSPLLGPGFGSTVGNLCVNVYTFSPDEQLVSCCSCLVTPNGLASLSVNGDLLRTTLTGVIPTSVTVKLVASVPETQTLAGGLVAWGTTVHTGPNGGGVAVSETPFRPATLSAGELASIRGRCASILGNGSGFGVCQSCKAGALGAGKQF